MADGTEQGGLKDRIARQGEDALGRLAQDLLENPIVTGAISRAFEARERAVQAQETAMSALNLPSAADIERLTRRLRSVAQRMEGLEEAVDRVEQRIGSMASSPAAGLEERLAAIEAQLGRMGTELSHVTRTLDAAPAPLPREQERLAVDAGGDAAKKPRASRARASSRKSS
jgi:chromosome segregation ATPase